MTQFLNLNVCAEIPEEVTITPAQSREILNQFEDILRKKDMDIEDSEYELITY